MEEWKNGMMEEWNIGRNPDMPSAFNISF